MFPSAQSFSSPTSKKNELWLNVKEEFHDIFWWSCVPGGSSHSHANNHSQGSASPCVTVRATRADEEGKANNSQGTCYLWVSSVGSRKHLRVPCTGSPFLSTVSLKGGIGIWGGRQSECLLSHERPWVPSPTTAKMNLPTLFKSELILRHR